MSTNPVQPLDPARVQRTEEEATHHGYFVRNAIQLDRSMATALAMTNDPNVTMSCVFAEWATEKPNGSIESEIGKAACRVLNFFDRDHGAAAEIGDLARDQASAAAIEAAPTVQQEGQ